MADRTSGALEVPGVVLVLGCPGRPDGTPSPTQRWRNDLAVAAAGPATRFVVTGHRGEAAQLARDLRERHRIAADRITEEPDAENTWGNVARSAPLISVGSRVLIVSDPLHAARAADYWRRQFPARAAELLPVRPVGWRHPVLRLAALAYEVVLRAQRYQPPQS